MIFNCHFFPLKYLSFGTVGGKINVGVVLYASWVLWVLAGPERLRQRHTRCSLSTMDGVYVFTLPAFRHGYWQLRLIVSTYQRKAIAKVHCRNTFDLWLFYFTELPLKSLQVATASAQMIKSDGIPGIVISALTPRTRRVAQSQLLM